MIGRFMSYIFMSINHLQGSSLVSKCAVLVQIIQHYLYFHQSYKLNIANQKYASFIPTYLRLKKNHKEWLDEFYLYGVADFDCFCLVIGWEQNPSALNYRMSLNGWTECAWLLRHTCSRPPRSGYKNTITT